jgi:ArsR family transcriptional regulator
MIDPQVINSIRESVPTPITIEKLSEFLRVFGDPSRLKLLYFLSRHELCVADLAGLADMQQSAVSHQLKLLRLHRLVRTRREGTTVYYSLDDLHIHNVLDIALEHVLEQT